MKKVYILFILSLVLAISGLTVSVDATDVIFDTSMTEIRDYENLLAQKKLNDFYVSFRILSESKIRTLSTNNLVEEDFAGMWIDENNHAHVGLTNSDSVLVKVAEQENIRVTYMNNSFEKLKDFQENIESKNLNILGTYILENINTLVIEVDDIDNLESIQNIIDSLNINNIAYYFAKGEKNHKYSTSLPAGRKIQNRGQVCTSGFKATYNGYTGFVTAGHCFNLGASIFTTSNAEIGMVIRRIVSASSGMDAAFVKGNNLVNLDIFPYDNMVTNNRYSIIPSTLNAVQGATVKYSKDGVTKACSITSTSSGAGFSDGYYSDLIKTNCDARGGDSGGIVITEFLNISLKKDLYAIGIVLGGNNSNTTYVIKARKIISSLGLKE